MSKKYVEFKDAKHFLDWLTLQPKKMQKFVEFELTFTDYTSKKPALVTFFTRHDELDGFDLYLAYTKNVDSENT